MSAFAAMRASETIKRADEAEAVQTGHRCRKQMVRVLMLSTERTNYLAAEANALTRNQTWQSGRPCLVHLLLIVGIPWPDRRGQNKLI
jgi:hypothetical protein